MGGVSLGGKEKEKTAWEQEAQMPIIQGMGTKGMGVGMGKGTNVPLVTLLIRVWILGALKACSFTSLRHY